MTTKAERILQFIIGFKRANDGNSPTLREISGACDVASTSVVRYHLGKLQRRGLIQMPKHGQCRMISVIGGRWNFEQPEVAAGTRHTFMHVQDPKLTQDRSHEQAGDLEDRS